MEQLHVCIYSSRLNVFASLWKSNVSSRNESISLTDDSPVSILYKSIAGRYRPVRVADGPITAHYRFIKNASWVAHRRNLLLMETIWSALEHNVTVCVNTWNRRAANTGLSKGLNCYQLKWKFDLNNYHTLPLDLFSRSSDWLLAIAVAIHKHTQLEFPLKLYRTDWSNRKHVGSITVRYILKQY